MMLVIPRNLRSECGLSQHGLKRWNRVFKKWSIPEICDPEGMCGMKVRLKAQKKDSYLLQSMR
jgi:hypothetical protein